MDGGNAENAGAIFGHVLKHAGLVSALASGAQLALRRKSNSQAARAQDIGGLRFANPPYMLLGVVDAPNA